MCAGLFLNGNPHKLNFGKIGHKRKKKNQAKHFVKTEAKNGAVGKGIPLWGVS